VYRRKGEVPEKMTRDVREHVPTADYPLVLADTPSRQRPLKMEPDRITNP
jgi:hypothetical protein